MMVVVVEYDLESIRRYVLCRETCLFFGELESPNAAEQFCRSVALASQIIPRLSMACLLV